MLTLLAPSPGSLAATTPVGPVLLSIGGRIAPSGQGVPAQFDMAMLEGLPQTSYSARPPWFSKPRKFTGPLLRDLMQSVGAQGQQARATALNDYRVDIPIADARRWDVVVARLLDDQPMSVRDKGPLLIIYPFDDHGELRSPLYFSRCAWQLRSLEVM